MFLQQLNSLRHNKFDSTPKVSYNLSANALEFQYEICQIFLKKTGEHLHQKECEMMQDSADLLLQIKRRDSDKTGYSSTDSGGESPPSSMPQLDCLNSFDSSRRGGGIWRKLDNRIGSWLAQIDEKCSALCLVNIKAIINDYRKLLEKWWEIQARQGLLQRKNAHCERQHQENLILKQKLNSQNLKVEELKEEVERLKQKNETILVYANQKLKELLGSQRVTEINDKVFRDVKLYLEDKQKNIGRRLLRVQLLEGELMDKLLGMMPVNCCEGCCVMLRKLKESLLRFKKYLQSEGLQLQNLIGKYKKTLFSQKSYSKLS